MRVKRHGAKITAALITAIRLQWLALRLCPVVLAASGLDIGNGPLDLSKVVGN
jgi:hypothetical protein